MKNLTALLLLALAFGLFSCEKTSMTQEQIEAMAAENQQLKAQANKAKEMEDQLALARMQMDEAMLKLAACEEAAMSRVHIIVGAFKTSSYADEYAAEIQNKGYDGKIFAGPYSFNLVSASSHESIRAALNALGPVRDGLVETAWIYLE